MTQEILFRAKLSVAWPIWAGGYPQQGDALHELESSRHALCAVLTAQLRAEFGAESSVELQLQKGAHNPIPGICPQDYQANSVDLFVIAKVVRESTCGALEIKTRVDNVVASMAARFGELAQRLLGAMQGANIYKVTGSWEPSHAIPVALQSPLIEHNAPWILWNIRQEADRTRVLLRRLRHLIEHGQIAEPPREAIAELGLHAGVLARAIQQYTIREEHVATDGARHPKYGSVMGFVAREARRDPSQVTAPVVHIDGPDESSIYRNELGFSGKEYDDLLTWKKEWDVHSLDPDAAFEAFSSQVISELQSARYSISVADIVPGVAGVVGIALNIAFFAPSLAVPSLVSSCATGLAAIAAKFPEVKNKLWGRGHS